MSVFRYEHIDISEQGRVAAPASALRGEEI